MIFIGHLIDYLCASKFQTNKEMLSEDPISETILTRKQTIHDTDGFIFGRWGMDAIDGFHPGGMLCFNMHLYYSLHLKL